MFIVVRQSSALSCLVLCGCVLAGFSSEAESAHEEPAPALLSSAQSFMSSWQEVDIGPGTFPGRVVDFGAGITIMSPGAASASADRMHFVYQRLIGDGELIVQVNAIAADDPLSRAGLMIRSDLTESATAIFTGATAGQGWVTQFRSDSTGAVETRSGPAGSAPGWARLVRAGSRFSAYQSDDGRSWQLTTEVTLPVPNVVYAGLVTVSHGLVQAMTIFMDPSVKSALAGLPGSTPGGLPGDPGPVPLPPSPEELEFPWNQLDLGKVSPAGSANTVNGEISIVGGGDTGDATASHFVYQPMTGDGEVVAQLRVIAADVGSLAGIYVRETLAASSPEIFLASSRENQWLVKYKDTPASQVTDLSYPRYPISLRWMKLVRKGDQFSTEVSIDGTQWTALLTRNIPMSERIYVGLAVASRGDGQATAIFSDVSVRSSGSANLPPTVSVLSPANGSSVSSNTALTVIADATDPEGSLARVTFRVNGEVVGTDTSAPYAVTLSPLKAGTYTVSAVATDQQGLSSDQAAVSVTVTDSSSLPPIVQLPGISIVSPMSGLIFSAPATIAIVAAATSGTVPITRVDFYGDDKLVGSATQAPYTVTWSNVSAGPHSVSAVAILSSGQAVTSGATALSVFADAVITPATLVFTPPPDESSTVESYTLEVFLSGGAVPVASKYLGKPATMNDEISVEVGDVISLLPSGTYVAVVSANGQGGSTYSQPSPTFVK